MGLLRVTAVALVACSAAGADPAATSRSAAGADPAAAPSSVAHPEGWKQLPGVAAAVGAAAKADGVTIDSVDAWGEPAHGCYAVWLELHGGASDAPVLAEQVVAGIARAAGPRDGALSRPGGPRGGSTPQPEGAASSTAASSNAASNTAASSAPTSRSAASNTAASSSVTASNAASSNVASSNVAASNAAASNVAAGNVAASNAAASNAAASNAAASNVASSNVAASNAAASNAAKTKSTVPWSEALTLSDVVKPTSATGSLAFAFTSLPYHGRVRAQLGKGRIAAVACFANEREPLACQAICTQLLGAR